MNIVQAVRYILQTLIPQVKPIAGEGIEVARTKGGSEISATFPGWLPHGEVYVANATASAWPLGTVVALSSSAVSDPVDATLSASIPTAGADGQFAVVSEPIAASSDGLAAVTGLAVAKMSAGYTELFAAPDGSGGLAGAASGPFRVLYADSTGGTALVAFAGGSGGAGGNAYYQGYFKLSVVEKTRQVENPDYDPEDPDSPQYIDEAYSEVHHSGGRYTVNGQVGTISAADVTGDLSAALQDVVLHYHYNGGADPEDVTPTGASVQIGSLASNTLTDSYWLIGQASTSGVVQQSHGVPALLWFGCQDAAPAAEAQETEE